MFDNLGQPANLRAGASSVLNGIGFEHKFITNWNYVRPFFENYRISSQSPPGFGHRLQHLVNWKHSKGNQRLRGHSTPLASESPLMLHSVFLVTWRGKKQEENKRNKREEGKTRARGKPRPSASHVWYCRNALIYTMRRGHGGARWRIWPPSVIQVKILNTWNTPANGLTTWYLSVRGNDRDAEIFWKSLFWRSIDIKSILKVKLDLVIWSSRFVDWRISIGGRDESD